MRYVAVAVLLWGCGDFPPFEPGSDLPEQSPEVPEGVAQAASDVTGTFSMTGDVMAAGMPIEVGFVGALTQVGRLGDGDATLQIALVPEDPEAEAPSFAAPTAVSAEGRFKDTVVDLVIPQSFSDLLAEDALADVEFDGLILDSDCLHGNLGLQLKEALTTISPAPLSIRLDGRFTATREGATCTFE